jgi:polyamine oxidase
MEAMPRRTFLSLLLASACTAPQGTDVEAEDLSRGSYDVVILGAGIAGLAAAQACLEKGARVIVLEAHNRLGGRTVRDSAGLPFEMGASWIHGVSGHGL